MDGLGQIIWDDGVFFLRMACVFVPRIFFFPSSLDVKEGWEWERGILVM